ncbi:hypothetical protein SAMN05661012_06763 [Chitinophaga sancti]|uniref:Uncharacterized protein n=1 Tax=Chitinophaga sancti TaxID=1004 RepID=A0A1K1T4N4_9BACT|nr:hypothetical protein SAMN05661012_06763 [Chitinophaga sancti]
MSKFKSFTIIYKRQEGSDYIFFTLCSPYVYNYNNPNNNVDPDGEEAYTLVGSAAQTAFRMIQMIMGGAPILGMRIHFFLKQRHQIFIITP